MQASKGVSTKEHSSSKGGSLHIGAIVFQFSKATVRARYSKAFRAFELMLKALQSLNVPESSSWYLEVEVHVHEELWYCSY